MCRLCNRLLGMHSYWMLSFYYYNFVNTKYKLCAAGKYIDTPNDAKTCVATCTKYHASKLKCTDACATGWENIKMLNIL